jgi:quinol-cytochrome oxidoreductase complex cytochrome b subunit
MRTAILAIVLVFIVAFAGLTIHAVAQSGPDALTVLSLLVLALLGFGVVGALRHPPE